MRQLLGVWIAFSMGMTSCGGSPPSHSAAPPATTVDIDCAGLVQADCFLFASMMDFALADDGSLRLNPTIPSYLDERGVLFPNGDPRRIYADRAAALAVAFLHLRTDPAAELRTKSLIDSAERRIVEAVPDGSGSAFGHRTAFNILHADGILAEIVRTADGKNPPPQIRVPDQVLRDPSHIFGSDEDSMISSRAVWDGPKRALPFHCCAGRIRISPMDIPGFPELALFPKAHQALMDEDKDYAATYFSIVGLADREAQSLPHTKEGRVRCDQLTSQVRHDLDSARLKDKSHILDKLEARARSMMPVRD